MRVFIASGFSPADAVAATNKGPDDRVLFVGAGSALPGETHNALLRLKPSEVIIVGGPSVVSEDVVRAIAALGFSTRRAAGANRFGTAAATALLDLAAPPVEPPWFLQVIFLPSLDAVHPYSKQRITTTLTGDGRARNLEALQTLESTLNQYAGGPRFRVRIDERGPLTTVSPYGGDSAWAAIGDVRQWIDPAANCVLVSYEIDDDSKKQGLNGLGGLGYYASGIAYGAVPAWDGDQLYILDMWGLGPYIHELLHGVCGYFASKGIPMPELHAPNEYGYTGERENLWGQDILGGKVKYISGAALTGPMPNPIPANGQLIGCTQEAWAVGAPRYVA